MTRFGQLVMNLLRIGLGVALLAWVIHLTGGVRALESLVTVPWLVPAFALQMALGAAVEARRLGWLAQALDVNVPFATGYRLVAVGTLFNNAIPGGTGGDLMKLYYLASENRSRFVMPNIIGTSSSEQRQNRKHGPRPNGLASTGGKSTICVLRLIGPFRQAEMLRSA